MDFSVINIDLGKEPSVSKKKKIISDAGELYKILFDARRGYEAWLVCVGQEYQKNIPVAILSIKIF